MDKDWTLTDRQFAFLSVRHYTIHRAFECDNMAYLRKLATTPKYLELFGAMSFDEAIDRYECVLEDAAKKVARKKRKAVN